MACKIERRAPEQAVQVPSQIDWSEVYLAKSSVWGTRADELLQQLTLTLKPGLALDLGIGEGRNAALLALHGHSVEGIDLEPLAVKRVNDFAKSGSMDISAQVADLRTARFLPDRYNLVVASNVLQFIPHNEIPAVLTVIVNALQPHGVFFARLFSDCDPGASSSLPRQDICYWNLERFTSLLPRELEVTLATEELELDLQHGEPHYHGMITIVGRKKGDLERVPS